MLVLYKAMREHVDRVHGWITNSNSNSNDINNNNNNNNNSNNNNNNNNTYTNNKNRAVMIRALQTFSSFERIICDINNNKKNEIVINYKNARETKEAHTHTHTHTHTHRERDRERERAMIVQQLIDDRNVHLAQRVCVCVCMCVCVCVCVVIIII